MKVSNLSCQKDGKQDGTIPAVMHDRKTDGKHSFKPAFWQAFRTGMKDFHREIFP